MIGPNRDRRPGRREPFRTPKPTILIVCEGEVTEKQYIEKLAEHHRNSRVTVKFAKEHGDPKTLVDTAKSLKQAAEKAARREHDANIKYDSVWCMFDIDEHLYVHEAREMASANGIRLAISNPCIELWLYMHLQPPPGMQHRHVMQGMLKALIPDYDKHVDFEKYAAGYDLAVTGAKQLDNLAASMKDRGRNPTTNVYELTESIIKVDSNGNADEVSPAWSPMIRSAPPEDAPSGAPGIVAIEHEALADDET